MEIAGGVALVTGSGGEGVGRSIALRLARDGAAVIVSDIDEVGGHETVLAIRKEGGQAIFVRANVGIEADIDHLFQKSQRAFGGIDILVNNAGPFHSGLLERWPETLSANLMGPIWTTLRAIPLMRRRHGGSILNFGSTSALAYGRRSTPAPAYDAAKAGLMHLTASLAPLASEGIRVNCLVPDWVATPAVRAYYEQLTEEQRKERGAPAVLTPIPEIEALALRLITDDTFAGRILVSYSGRPPALLSPADQGYASMLRMPLEDPAAAPARAPLARPKLRAR